MFLETCAGNQEMHFAGFAHRAPSTPAARWRESPAQAWVQDSSKADPGLGGSLLSRTPDAIHPPTPEDVLGQIGLELGLY